MPLDNPSLIKMLFLGFLWLNAGSLVDYLVLSPYCCLLNGETTNTMFLSSMYICKALQKFKLNVYIFLHAHPKSGRIINELIVAAFW
jgi:hypothetical protein